MNYKDINDKWKSFLFENTFKEDVIFDPEQEKKKKKKKKEKNTEKKREDGKEIITNEYEEFGEDPIEEISSMSGGPGDSSGSVEGHMGGSKGPWMSKKAFKRKWA